MTRRVVPLATILSGLPPVKPEAERHLSADLWCPTAPRFSDRFFSPQALVVLVAAVAICAVAGEAYAQVATPAKPSVFATVLKWLPLILFGSASLKQIGTFPGFTIDGSLGGFALNIAVSFLVMAIGTVIGVPLGVAQISRVKLVRVPAWAVTQFFRNAPWLVLLFFTILVIPFQIRLFGQTIFIPDWMKAVFGLTLPIMANVAEVTRGAILSINYGQWEASESLGLSSRQTLRLVILPQCIKRMTPPWMNWYAILTMATSLVSVVGVDDAMTLTQNALAAEGRSELLLPMYGTLLLLFFLYCYSIALYTQRLERRFQVA